MPTGKRTTWPLGCERIRPPRGRCLVTHTTQHQSMQRRDARSSAYNALQRQVRLRAALSNTVQRRMEKRTATRVRLELSSLGEPPVREISLTENVSLHGICALTRNRWLPDNTALVVFLDEDVAVHARIAYCNALGNAFSVGLQFSTPIDLWISPQEPGHLR
jgi:hypothetical protein